MKTFYSDYIGHCLRFYARHRQISNFRSNIDKNNWYACDAVIKTLPRNEQELLLTVFGVNADQVAKVVTNLSKERHINAGKLWKTIYEIEKRVARKRGLI